jgi:hypothetical protein
VKVLSVKNVLKNAYEVKRLKYLLLSYEECSKLRSVKILIDFNSAENESIKNKTLQINDFVIVDNDLDKTSFR